MRALGGEQLGKEGFRLARVGRGLIVNIEYVRLIDVTDNKLVLSDYQGHNHEFIASREALKDLSLLKNRLITEGII